LGKAFGINLLFQFPVRIGTLGKEVHVLHFDFDDSVKRAVKQRTSRDGNETKLIFAFSRYAGFMWRRLQRLFDTHP